MSSRFDPQPPDRSSGTGRDFAGPGAAISTKTGAANEPETHDFLSILASAEKVSREYQSRTIERPLARSYRAWQNQHAEGSKYLDPAFRGRSRNYVPKTRSAVRKTLANAAAALFTTEDVAAVTATFEEDDVQRATAAVIKADLNYRLRTANTKHGIPWFQISMGACLDAQLTGVCISKQFWEYEDKETGEVDVVAAPVADEMGTPVLDEFGRPLVVDVEVPVRRTVKDRPVIELHPIENAGIDPAAPWYAPAQLGRWFFMRVPMGYNDALTMIERNRANDDSTAWLDVDPGAFLQSRSDETRNSTRRVREGGTDRMEQAKVPGPLDIVWLQENFIRIDGTDWHFWSLGRHTLLSRPRPVEESYPELEGERPYAMGAAQIDAHRVFPMSPVESWQPLQLELNDIANLRLDTLKRSIAPLAVVRKGRNVDINAVQRRGQPDAVVMVDDIGDVVFQQTPGPSGQAYTETAVVNSNFDELAGLFSTSSVQQSRQLNETVGGMMMMSSAAGSVSEFDLRMWCETWVEPALRQVVHMIRYHESDERVLAIAGGKARVMERFGYMPGLSDFEQTEISVRINAGIGTADPMMRVAKLRSALEMLAPMMPIAKARGIEINIEALIEEVMGSAGFSDGRRFFEFGEPQEPQPDPDVIKLMETMKLEREKAQLEHREAMMELASAERRNAENNRVKLSIAGISQKTELVKQAVGVVADRELRREGASRQAVFDLFAGRSPSTPAPVVNRAPEAAAVQPVMRNDAVIRLDQITSQITALAETNMALLRAVDTLARQIQAPAEVVRDPVTGRAIGVRKAGHYTEITRGADGRISGSVPLVA